MRKRGMGKGGMVVDEAINIEIVGGMGIGVVGLSAREPNPNTNLTHKPNLSKNQHLL